MIPTPNKRSRQSPDLTLAKVTKLTSSLSATRMVNTPENTPASFSGTKQLDENGQLLLANFRQVLCEELNNRFALFSKEDFVPLKEDVKSMRDELNTLKEEVASLKEDNKDLASQFERSNNQLKFLERDARDFHLIFYNVAKSTNVYQSIMDICQKILNVREPLNIRRTTVLKQDRAKNVLTVLVKFDASAMVNAVLRCTNNLRGNSAGIGISRDLSEEERRTRSLLLKVKRQIQQTNTSEKVKVISNKLIVKELTFWYNSKTNKFGNAEIDGKHFLRETFSIDFDNLVANMQ